MKDEGYENILHAFMVRKFLTTPHNHSITKENTIDKYHNGTSPKTSTFKRTTLTVMS